MADQVTQERLHELLTYDPASGVFTRKVKTSSRARLNKEVGSIDSRGYRQICLLGRLHLAHRLAWVYVYGEWPSEQIDHINRNRLDNRIANLRVVTCSENSQNSGMWRNNTSGHKGVYWNKPRQQWTALMMHARKRLYLGHFDDQYEAVMARKTAEALLYTVQRFEP